jgi:S-adenosylmethionine hydrolase
MPPITLTTDFGTTDWFVGAMKGVILEIQPAACVVDLTHGLPAGDIRAGAFALLAGYRAFPRGTIHVVVVDPGVGSDRRALVVASPDYLFVGPDNGVLSWALGREAQPEIRQLTNERYLRQPVSQTFHGRDVFAPVAAHLSRGIPPAAFGPVADQPVHLPWPQEDAVLYIDRFGNAITNIDRAQVRAIQIGDRRIAVEAHYQAVPAGEPVVVRGSSGFLEIAVNGGPAAEVLGLQVGDALTACV